MTVPQPSQTKSSGALRSPQAPHVHALPGLPRGRLAADALDLLGGGDLRVVAGFGVGEGAGLGLGFGEPQTEHADASTSLYVSHSSHRHVRPVPVM
ncbi:hypothetical protein [Streptomyces sp. 6N223]|uniref:hypothetical protein n=1 Tax=Streptomyces sp. 6N223 TaxID=3457412 RepID=UPI003FD4932F